MWIYKIQRQTIFSDCKSHLTQICICLGIRIFFFRICKTCMHPITCRSPVPCWNMKRNHQLSRSHRMFTNLHILLTHKRYSTNSDTYPYIGTIQHLVKVFPFLDTLLPFSDQQTPKEASCLIENTRRVSLFRIVLGVWAEFFFYIRIFKTRFKK